MIPVQNITKEELYNVIVPQKTNYYTPIHHRDVIESILEEIDKNNFRVVKEEYRVASKGHKLIGYFDLDANDSEFGIRVAFRNSYDKSMSFALVSGNFVAICSNGMITGEYSMKRKHTGLADYIADNYIHDTISQVGDIFEEIKRDSLLFKSQSIDEKNSAQWIGELLIKEEIINGMQAGIVREQLYHSEKFNTIPNNDFSVWDLYNHVTESLKRSHPLTYIADHCNLHKFMLDKFD